MKKGLASVAAAVALLAGCTERPAPAAAAPAAGARPDAPPVQKAPPKLRVSQEKLRRLVPVIPNQRPLISVGETMDVQGMPMAVATYETKKDAVEILTFYGRYFEQQGWPRSASVKDSLELLATPGLSATLPDELLQVSVLVEDDPQDDVRTVVLGLADVAALARRPAPGPPEDDFPRYPGSRASVITMRDEGAPSHTVAFDTTDPPEQVMRFLTGELGKRGYQPAADPGLSSVLRFEAPGRSWELAIITRGNLTTVTAHGQGVQRSASR